MSERDWKEEQRDALTRLFEAAFERREVPERRKYCQTFIGLAP
jgi:hypothetical protein